MSWNNLHQEFEEDWKLTKVYGEPGQGSWLVNTKSYFSFSRKHKVICSILLQLNVPSTPCSDSYFKRSLGVTVSDFLCHTSHTHISTTMFRGTAAANKFKQLFPHSSVGPHKHKEGWHLIHSHYCVWWETKLKGTQMGTEHFVICTSQKTWKPLM